MPPSTDTVSDPVSGPVSGPVVTDQMVQYLLNNMNKGYQGTPLSKYLKWFAKMGKMPVHKAQSHPAFWNPECLRAFIQFYELNNQTALDVDIDNLMSQFQQKSAALNTALDDSDDDMPEPKSFTTGDLTGLNAGDKDKFKIGIQKAIDAFGPGSGGIPNSEDDEEDEEDDAEMPGPRSSMLKNKTVDEIIGTDAVPVLDGLS